MSKELAAFKDIWYGQKTAENYQIVQQALETLNFIKNCQVIKLHKKDNANVLVVLPLTFYVDAKRYDILKDVFEL